MSSLAVIPQSEELTGLPALPVATATTRQLLDALGLEEPSIDGGGALLTRWRGKPDPFPGVRPDGPSVAAEPGHSAQR